MYIDLSIYSRETNSDYIDDLPLSSDNTAMKRILQLNMFLLILLYSGNTLFSVELHDGKKIKLELDLLLGMEGYFQTTLLLGKGGFDLTEGKVALKGELFDNLDFKVSADMTDIDGGSEDIPFLKDLYGRYEFHDYARIKAGRFELPFGQESLKGLGSRPNIYHSEAADLIVPERSIGLALEGKKILDYWGYSLSACNASGSPLIDEETGHFLFTGALFFKNDFVKTGYNAYFSTDENFSQGIYTDFSFQLSETTELDLLIEYLEKRFYNYHWNHALYALISLRTGSVEPLLYFDYYNDKVGYDGVDDKWKAGLGCNFYFLQDRLKLMVDLHTNYLYSLQESFNKKFYDNRLTLKLVLEI